MAGLADDGGAGVGGAAEEAGLADDGGVDDRGFAPGLPGLAEVAGAGESSYGSSDAAGGAAGCSAGGASGSAGAAESAGGVAGCNVNGFASPSVRRTQITAVPLATLA